MIREFIWRVIARLCIIPAVRDWIISRAQRTPYHHIHGKDGSVYMFRWWVFNPYRWNPETGGGDGARWEWLGLPSIRLHCIMRPDSDRELHDHPWNARTIVLDGSYEEIRPLWQDWSADGGFIIDGHSYSHHVRQTGYTGRLLFGQYHRITRVPPLGVYTLFFTWRKRGTWGFLVDGKKVPYREHLGLKP